MFAQAYTFIDGKLDVFLNGRLSSVIAQVQGPLRVALVLYVVLYGVAILRGAISEPIMDFAVRALKLAVLYALATSVAYTSYVTDPLFHGLPNVLAQAISGSDVANVGGSFDQFFGYGAQLSEKMLANAQLMNIGTYIVAGVVFIVTAIATALGFGVVVIAKVALALLVTLGPIFIGCALFDATRRFFFGWLSQAVNYLVLFALMLTIFQLVLELVKAQWPSIDGQANAEIAGMLFSALCILGAIFFLQTPAIAAGIAGGASAGLADFVAVAAVASRGSSSRPSQAAAPQGAPQARASGSIEPSGARP